MDPQNTTGNASNHASGDKRKRNADTLLDDVNDGGVGSSLCCSCVHCSCGCHHNLGKATTDEVYLDSLPIGYRFDPTDEELITHYLWKKIKHRDLPKNKIGEADIYGNHPKDIVVNYPQAIEGAWYFFTPRNRKYVNGNRPNRKAGFGYWKATGPDNPILANGAKIGGRKSLVYHEGHPPKGTKTDWMMQEFVVVGYKRERSDLQDMKLDDYVLCKIYTNTKSGKENNEQQQPRVATNDQAVAPYQEMSKQETNPTNFQMENKNVGVQHFQNSIHPTVRDSDQHVNPTIAVKEVNPSIFHLENDGDVQDSNHVENSSPIMDSNQHMMNPSVESGVREAKRHVLVNDQQTRPTINFQFENNVVVQNNYQHVGSFYDPMTPYPSSILNVQRTNFPRIRAPLGHDYPLTRFNHNYSLPNPPYFPPTPTKSALPPPRITNAPHMQMHQGVYWPGSSFSPTFQEGYDYDGSELLNNNIVDMYSQDGFLGDIYHLPSDGHDEVDVNGLEEVDVDEQKKQ